MDSIKNAIVTVTLLAVGYGSYVVLQDERPKQSSKEQMAAVDETEGINELEVTIGDTDPVPLSTEPAVPADQSAPNSLAHSPENSASPLPGHPFDGGPLEGSTVAPPVADLAEDETMGSANAASLPNPNTGPFASPVVVTADPLAAQDTDAALPKTDTSVVGTPRTDLDVPAVDVSPILPSDASQGSLVFEQDWTKAQQEIRGRSLAAALSTLSKWTTDMTLNSEQRERCLRLTDELAGTVIYSREHHLEPEYQVRAGETLAEISKAYRVPQSLIAKINGVAPPYALATGEKLKVIPGPFRAELSLASRELTLFLGSYYAGRFAISVGPDVPPEAAVYEVAEKANGRSYFDRRIGKEVPLGDKTNRYGNHWLGLRGEHITTGHSVGIHGRPLKPSEDDMGSISLDPLGAEDIFSILSVGSQVIVNP